MGLFSGFASPGTLQRLAHDYICFCFARWMVITPHQLPWQGWDSLEVAKAVGTSSVLTDCSQGQSAGVKF